MEKLSYAGVMGDFLFEVLLPHLEQPGGLFSADDKVASTYLTRLSTLPLEALTSTEPESLDHEANSLIRSMQALMKRSYKSINASSDSLGHLESCLPALETNVNQLQNALPTLEKDALLFAEKYSKPSENPILDRRKRAMRLGENVNRLSDILELPALLSSTIAASNSGSSGGFSGSSVSSNANYASALDLYAHIRRLRRLYPESELIKSILLQAEDAMRNMTTNLISALRSQSLKLAAAMRLIGLLRRVVPDLDSTSPQSTSWASSSSEDSFGALFLVCRLTNLTNTLEALEPLRELADQDSEARTEDTAQMNHHNTWSAGHQTERYLKRYVEVFREQCFAITSMYKSIFPTSLQGPASATPQIETSAILQSQISLRTSTEIQSNDNNDLPLDSMQLLPSALATFTSHLVDMLFETLRNYMPNVRDQSSRDSLLTQVLYCAGSLGRLGGDFGLLLSTLEDELEDNSNQGVGEASDGHVADKSASPEWIEVMKKHRVQASRLELLADGVNSGRTGKSATVAFQ